MNHLNSVVIEGNVKGSVQFTEQVLTSIFNIEVKRELKDGNGKTKTEFTVIPIKSVGNFAVEVVKRVVDGQSVRVVGRLVNSGSQIVVFAEHLEWKTIKEEK